MLNLKKKDIFIQDTVSSCGACSIASVVSFYGGYVPLEVILEDTETDKNGTNALYLVEALKKYGFDAYGKRITIDELSSQNLPLIAHTNKKGLAHFLVVYKITDKGILTMDPEIGKKIYTKDEFREIFTGNAILFLPKMDIPIYKKNNKLKNYLSNIVLKNPLRKVTIFMSLFVIGLNIILSFHLKVLNSHSLSPKVTVIFILISMLVALIDYLKNRIIVNLINEIDFKTIHDFTTHIFKLPKKYLKMRRVGEIIAKIENISLIKDLFVQIAIVLILNILSIISVTSVMVLISWKLTLIYSTTIILYLIFSFISQEFQYKEEKKTAKFQEEYSGVLVEYLDGIESIKNLNSEDIFLNKLTSIHKTYINSRIKKDKKYLMFALLRDNIFKIGTIIVNTIGYLMLNDSFTFLELLTLDSLYSIIYSSAEGIIDIFKEFIRGKAVYKRISEFYDLETEKVTPNLIGNFESLSIENLSYSYDRLKNTINNFNFELLRGEKVLINGPSGIGKSTLVKCISSLLDNYKGCIKINGIDTKNLSGPNIREYITYIGQEERLFTNSILDNITLGKFDKNKFENIKNIASLDEIFDKRQMSENTMLLEGGSNISGGERARIILARALYKEPSILIIDETLSSISEELEDEIIKKLFKLENMSLIYITHRNKKSLFKNIIEFRKDGSYEITRK